MLNFHICAAIAYSSASASVVMCRNSGSSVASDTYGEE